MFLRTVSLLQVNEHSLSVTDRICVPLDPLGTHASVSVLVLAVSPRLTSAKELKSSIPVLLDAADFVSTHTISRLTTIFTRFDSNLLAHVYDVALCHAFWIIMNGTRRK